jgi:hypothetical protein
MRAMAAPCGPRPPTVSHQPRAKTAAPAHSSASDATDPSTSLPFPDTPSGGETASGQLRQLMPVRLGEGVQLASVHR